MSKCVFIYSDEGTDKAGIASIEENCRKRLKLPYRYIKSEDILDGVLQGKNIFVMPGGADLPYCKKLNGLGNRKIRKFIEDGGFYIGICAGAYYACRRINFKGKDYDVSGNRELGLFEGTAEGSLPFLTDGNYFSDNGAESKAMISLKFKEKLSKEYFYYHGGPVFIPDSIINHKYRVIAKYEDNTPAVIKGKIGKGNYLLSAVHFELEKEQYRKFVLEKADMKDKDKEEIICNHFTENYGNRIWNEIVKIINKQ